MSQRAHRVAQCIGTGVVAVCLMLSLPGQALPGEAGQESAEPPVLMPPVTVQAQPIGKDGTGTLGLREQSNGSSRLGLTLREIPASVDVVTQQTMQDRKSVV